MTLKTFSQFWCVKSCPVNPDALSASRSFLPVTLLPIYCRVMTSVESPRTLEGVMTCSSPRPVRWSTLTSGTSSKPERLQFLGSIRHVKAEEWNHETNVGEFWDCKSLVTLFTPVTIPSTDSTLYRGLPDRLMYYDEYRRWVIDL